MQRTTFLNPFNSFNSFNSSNSFVSSFCLLLISAFVFLFLLLDLIEQFEVGVSVAEATQPQSEGVFDLGEDPQSEDLAEEQSP